MISLVKLSTTSANKRYATVRIRDLEALHMNMLASQISKEHTPPLLSMPCKRRARFLCKTTLIVQIDLLIA